MITNFDLNYQKKNRILTSLMNFGEFLKENKKSLKPESIILGIDH